MTKLLNEVAGFLVADRCRGCKRYKGNNGDCEGKVYSEGCLGYLREENEDENKEGK